MPAPEPRKPSQPLPQKEQGIFRKVVEWVLEKLYEQKQYRNGLRHANTILRNHPDHGETLSMKGLILNCQGKREEAREFVKKGLRSDINSHVCWHVYGLFHRSEKKYEEAIKAYRNALARDKDNMQILRDLSLLQIQMRDVEGFKETRYTLLTLRPTQRASWIGYAMSYHLLREYDTALRILSEFIKGQTPSSLDFEHSELLLYQNMVLREAGKVSEALAHLNEHEFHIVDKTKTLELKGELHLREGRAAVAAEMYRELIGRNPDNRGYYESLERCLDMDRDECLEARLALYAQYRAKFPRSNVPHLAPLTFLKGQRFREEADAYLRAGLRKGLPSLFHLVRALYASPEKATAIGEIALNFKNELEQSSHEALGMVNGTTNGHGESEEVPTTLLWTYYFLAQHFDKLGEVGKSLELVNAALQHTPTLIELLTLKAKIFKHAGAPGEAVVCTEEAQSLDTADRFINCKAAKYLLRDGQVEAAEAMAGKFTREGPDPMTTLNEMQCMWFESEAAAAFYRLGMLGHALRKCHEIERHCSDIEEDQFDFHTYCVRRMTLSSYVGLLRMVDTLRSHPFYYKAARLAIKIYLRLYDCPSEASGGGKSLKSAEEQSEAESRKAERKKKKAEAKQEQERKEAGKKAAEKKTDPDEPVVAVAPLDPKALLKVEKPLDEAVKFLAPLLELKSERIDAYILGFHVYWRKEKVLRMTQCLRRAVDLEPLYPKLHVCKIRFLMFLEGKSWEGAVGEILNEELQLIFGSERDPVALNAAFAAAHASSYPHLIAAAEAGVVLRGYGGGGGDGRSAELVNAVIKAVETPAAFTGFNLKSLVRAWKSLSRGVLGPGVDSVVLERFRSHAAGLCPLAEAFQSPEQRRLAQLKLADQAQSSPLHSPALKGRGMKAWEEFGCVVERVVGGWASYRYAVRAGLGGAQSAAKDEWLRAQLLVFFRDNKDLEPDEVCDWLSSVLFNEFDVVFEDGSTEWVAGLLTTAFDLLRDDRAVELEERVFAHIPSEAKIAESQARSKAQEEESEEDSEDDPEPTSSVSTRKVVEEAKKDVAGSAVEAMEVEDGWTPVRRKKK